MPNHKIEVAPDLIAEGKRLYENTLTPVADIAGVMGLTRWTLAARIKEWKWSPRQAHGRRGGDIFHAMRGAVAAITADAQASGADVAAVAAQQRAAIAAGIQSLVETQLNAAAQILAVLKPSDAGEAERSARTLANIARTVREIMTINQPQEMTPPDEADDDPVPRDLDEFRFELARRIRGFIEARGQNGAPRLLAEPESPVE